MTITLPTWAFWLISSLLMLVVALEAVKQALDIIRHVLYKKLAKLEAERLEMLETFLFDQGKPSGWPGQSQTGNCAPKGYAKGSNLGPRNNEPRA